MQLNSVKLQPLGARSEVHLIVPSTMLLRDVAKELDSKQPVFLFVENCERQMIGVVEPSHVKKLLSTGSPEDMQRWGELSVESVLEWRLTKSPKLQTEELSPAKPFTLVSDANGLSAIASQGEVFVNLNMVKDSLIDATIDVVTGLPNRRTFERRLNEELYRANRYGHSVGVVLFDVDFFKGVNDMYGHGVGDEVLKAIADTIKELLRSYDLLVRYGGDEFAAICFGCNKDEIDVPLRRVRQHFKSKFASCGIKLPPISLTVGAVIAHDTSLFESAAELVALADTALYRGKEAGRDSMWKLEVSNRADIESQPCEILPVASIPFLPATDVGGHEISPADLPPS